MRINRDSLQRFAQETIARRAREDRSLTAVYLCGSFLEEEYYLGGTADVDLVFIHLDRPAVEREIVRLTDEVHLDISHQAEADYREARQLRVHPWMGPVLNACKVMFDPHHFLDFTQASVRGQFNRADNVYERSRRRVEEARQIWFAYQDGLSEVGPTEVLAYLRAVSHAANAIAGLLGAPLTERRFLLNYPQRTEAIGRAGLTAGLLGLLGAPNLEADSIAEWLPLWRNAYEAIPVERTPARLHPQRRLYYQQAFEAMIGASKQEAVLYPLLRTWTMAVSFAAKDSPIYKEWSQALMFLGLLGVGFAERMRALDAYLDVVEETLENWARDNGVWVR